MTAVNANIVLVKSWEISPDSFHFRAAQEFGCGKLRVILWISREADEAVLYPFLTLDYALYRLCALKDAYASVESAEMIYGSLKTMEKAVSFAKGTKIETALFASAKTAPAGGGRAEENSVEGFLKNLSGVKNVSARLSPPSKAGLEIEEWCPAYVPYWKDAKILAALAKKKKTSKEIFPPDAAFLADGRTPYHKLREEFMSHFAARAALMP